MSEHIFVIVVVLMIGIFEFICGTAFGWWLREIREEKRGSVKLEERNDERHRDY